MTKETTFELATEIERDTVPLVDMDLCRVVLMNDKRFPWLILLPMQPDLVEVFDLEEEDQVLFWLEVNYIAKVLSDFTGCQKVNVASLGNMVSQLHMHVVARNDGDAAWPGPVWGVGNVEPYTSGEVDALVTELKFAINYD